VTIKSSDIYNSTTAVVFNFQIDLIESKVIYKRLNKDDEDDDDDAGWSPEETAPFVANALRRGERFRMNIRD
jgi:hypothetical protein